MAPRSLPKGETSYVRHVKTEYEQEIYLSRRINVHAHRSLFAKLRGGTAPLAIELGRYRRPIIPRENRLCPLCERAGGGRDPFILECPVLSQKREKLFAFVHTIVPDLTHFSVSDQLKTIMVHPRIVKPAASIIYNMFMERRALVNY